MSGGILIKRKNLVSMNNKGKRGRKSCFNNFVLNV